MSTRHITYEQYAEYAQRIRVTPYSRKAWDAMTPLHRALIGRLAS